MKKHWNVGNKHAVKEVTLDDRLAFRCSREEYEYVTGRAELQGSITAVIRGMIVREMSNSEDK